MDLLFLCDLDNSWLPLVTFEPADRKCTENWRKTSRPSFGHEHFESDGNA